MKSICIKLKQARQGACEVLGTDKLNKKRSFWKKKWLEKKIESGQIHLYFTFWVSTDNKPLLSRIYIFCEISMLRYD